MVILGILLFLTKDRLMPLFFTPRQTPKVNSIQETDNKEANDEKQKTIQTKKDIEVIAENLNVPWELAFLPNKEMLVTQRSGELLKIGTETKVLKEIEGVKHIGEGGLLGLAIHPKFSENRFIYLYLTTEDSNGISNRVERYTLIGDTLDNKKVIVDNIKGSIFHDGGRIKFGPEGYLYITTGDAQIEESAQDTSSLSGKILRVTDNGSIPSDNPFKNEVYSLGHRNPQGLAWDTNGTLWETEHGPSGIQTGFDEINSISKGGNYGWPAFKGTESSDKSKPAILSSGQQDTWAPSGMVYWDNSLFFSGLRGEALYEAKILADNKLKLVTHFKEEYGRIRAVALGPDNYLYITTSNTDGRGQKKYGDDKIIRINPQIFR